MEKKTKWFMVLVVVALATALGGIYGCGSSAATSSVVIKGGIQ